MTSCGRGRDSATLECFGRGYQGTIYVRSSKLSLFLPELCPIRRVFFCFPRFWKIWCQMFQLWGFWFWRCVGALFENSTPSPGIFFANSYYDHKYFLKISFLFFQSRAGFTCLTTMAIPSLSKSTLVIVRRKPEWKLDFRALARSSAEGPSIVGAIGKSRVQWSMVKKRKKNTRKSACDCAKAQPFIIYKPGSFEEPVSETQRRYRFSLRCFRGRGCTATGRSDCSAGPAKKSSHPRHFRCWSLRCNELECTDLVHWTEALDRFRHVMQLRLLILSWSAGEPCARAEKNLGRGRFSKFSRSIRNAQTKKKRRLGNA